MRLKKVSTKKLSGIPNARTAVAGGEEGGSRTVVLIVSSVDCFDMPSVEFSLRCSPDEADDLAERLRKCAAEQRAAMKSKTLVEVFSQEGPAAK